MNCKPKVLSDSTYQMYKDMIFKSVLEGWATVWPKMSGGKIIEGYYNPNYGLCQDKMWAQGFYGTFLALDWRKSKDQQTLNYTVDFVNAVNDMLKRTKGIYLRDNTKHASDLYESFQGNLNKKKDLEISRDQIIGLTAALYMIYRYMDESAAPIPEDKQKIKSLKENIFTLISNLESMFKQHEQPFYYPLFNELENRELGNHANCWTFKPPLELAFDRVLRGAETGTNDEEGISLTKLISYIEQLEPAGDSIDISWLEEQAGGALNSSDISKVIGDPARKKDFLKAFSIPYFNWNLVMYFLLIAGSESKAWANVAFSFIDTFILLGFKHMNLAAVYCYLAKLWNIEGLFLDKNKEILSHDIYLFPDGIVPCQLAGKDCQWGSFWPAPNKPVWWWNFDSVCQDPADNDNWCTPPPCTKKTIDDIKEASKGGVIDVDCGLSLLFRNLLYSF